MIGSQVRAGQKSSGHRQATYLNMPEHRAVKRVRIPFAGREVEFVDREAALRQLGELAEGGTWWPLVIYGPEGCGKTALLRQARAVFEDYGYHVVYVDPLAERVEEVLQYTPSIRDIVLDVARRFPEPYARIVDVAISVASHVMRSLSRPRVAVLMDDVFQAVGVDRAEQYVKTLLNLIEWPPADYDKVVVLVASSEGVTRERVGRHRWAEIRAMWNMPREGFQQLYEHLPSPKPPTDEAWRLTGGNPEALERLYRAGWDVGRAVDRIVREGALDAWVFELGDVGRRVLVEVLDEPDILFYRAGDETVRVVKERLVEKNLVARVWQRDPDAWIDVPPPERDPELGIGKYYAWQTPIHREAVKRALEAAGR